MGGAQQDPNNAEEPPRNEENVPAEIVCMLETTSGAINGDNEDLVRNLLPGMVDNDNQLLLENIPTAGEENEGNNMQCFSEWEHSGSCYHCLEGGCKNKARINFNTNVKPTIQQQFEIFFKTIFYWNNHPTDEQTVTRRKTLPSLLWQVSLLDWSVVSYGHNK